ncbi:MAG: 3'-5' exoribonuclease YhaM family protein [Bacillota bacterium]
MQNGPGLKKVYVAEIKAGIKVHSRFIVRSKRLIPYKGRPGHFLSMTLADRSGQVEAKVWEGAEEAYGMINTGDLIEVRGNAVEYNGFIQISASSYRICPESDYDAREFLPASPLDAAEMLADLRALIDSVENSHLRRLLFSFFDDREWVGGFCSAPAAKANHQAYLGGLLEHTLNLTRTASVVAGLYPRLDRDLLLAGAILHDIGKIGEYSYDRLIDFTDEGRLLGHIVMGVNEVDRRMSGLSGEEPFPEDLRLKLLHIITSHHGQYEWQSPKKPKFLEAAVVHILDMLDSVMDTFTKTVDENAGENSSWSPWVKSLERYVYLK